MRNCLLSIVLLGLSMNGYSEETFGRFFTTSQQRDRLDELRTRHSQEELVVEIAEDELDAEETPVEKRPPVDAVRLKGLVYRQDGKSTAWLNDGNTFEGDIGSQYLRIERIEPDNVTLDIDGDESRIKLKAGQAYEPANKKIHDVTKQ